MPNRLHLILVPQDEDGIRAVLATTHRRYAGIVNTRRKRTGHFWQGRYGSAVMDEAHLAAAFRYILRCPVAAKLAQAPERWRWSSARAYLKGANDGLTVTGPMRGRFPGIRALLGPGGEELDGLTVRADETIGRPRGSAAFIARIEKKTGRTLAPAKRGPVPRGAKRKPKAAARSGK